MEVRIGDRIRVLGGHHDVGAIAEVISISHPAKGLMLYVFVQRADGGSSFAVYDGDWEFVYNLQKEL